MLSIRLQMAHQLRQSGQLEQAETVYRKIIADYPDDAKALTALGLLYREQREFDMARELLEKAVQVRPDSAHAHLWLGAFLRDLNEFDQACVAYRKAAELDPDNAQPYFEIAIMTKYDEVTDEVRNMLTMYDSAKGNIRKRRQLGFALGKVFDDLH